MAWGKKLNQANNEVGISLEELIKLSQINDKKGFLVKVRIFLEHILRNFGGQIGKGENLGKLLEKTKGKLPNKIWHSIYYLKSLGNLGAHSVEKSEELEDDEIEVIVDIFVNVIKWYNSQENLSLKKIGHQMTFFGSTREDLEKEHSKEIIEKIIPYLSFDYYSQEYFYFSQEEEIKFLVNFRTVCNKINEKDSFAFFLSKLKDKHLYPRNNIYFNFSEESWESFPEASLDEFFDMFDIHDILEKLKDYVDNLDDEERQIIIKELETFFDEEE